MDASLSKRKEDKPNLIDQEATVSKTYLECVKSQLVLVLFTTNNKVQFLNLLPSKL